MFVDIVSDNEMNEDLFIIIVLLLSLFDSFSYLSGSPGLYNLNLLILLFTRAIHFTKVEFVKASYSNFSNLVPDNLPARLFLLFHIGIFNHLCKMRFSNWIKWNDLSCLGDLLYLYFNNWIYRVIIKVWLPSIYFFCNNKTFCFNQRYNDVSFDGSKIILLLSILIH